MGLFDLLMGKSNAEAPQKQIHPIDSATTPEEFLQIFLNEDDVHLRKEFIKKVHDQNLLIKILKAEKNENVRLLGLKRLKEQDVLLDIVLNDSSYKLRSAALWQITDSGRLKDIIEKCDNKYIVQSAKERIETVQQKEGVKPKPAEPKEEFQQPVPPDVTSHDGDEETDSAIYDELTKRLESSVEQRLISDLNKKDHEREPFAKEVHEVETDDDGVMSFSAGNLDEQCADAKEETDEAPIAGHDIVEEKPKIEKEPLVTENQKEEKELSDQEKQQVYDKISGDLETPKVDKEEEPFNEEVSEEQPAISEPAAMKVFMAMFKQLSKYKANYGHCNVPVRWKENRELAKWVSETRKNKSGLEETQVSALDELGFDWSPFDS